MALHIYNEMVMKTGNKSGLYAHTKRLIEKGKELNDSKLKLYNR